jgi:hypothetical protein
MTAAHTAAQDQYQAAVNDARHRLDTVARQAIQPTHSTSQVTDWLNAQLAELSAATVAGTVRLCPHIGPGPMVIHAAVWDRWRLVCTTCLPALLPADPAAENICDRCHRHAPLIHPGTAAAGPLLLAFGLCTPCTGAAAGHAPTTELPTTPTQEAPADAAPTADRQGHTPQ